MVWRAHRFVMLLRHIIGGGDVDDAGWEAGGGGGARAHAVPRVSRGGRRARRGARLSNPMQYNNLDTLRYRLTYSGSSPEQRALLGTSEAKRLDTIVVAL